MRKPPAYDVFFSYHHQDAATVESLARHLGQEGFRVWLDSWELVPGAPVRDAIDDALSESLVFAACVGEGASEWLERELGEVMEGEGEGSRVVPILLPGASELPQPLADFQAVDLRTGVTGESLDLLVQLLGELRSGGGGAGATDATSSQEGFAQIDYRQLIENVDEVLAEEPDNVEALRARLFAMMALGRSAEALETIERLEVLAPDDHTVATQKLVLLVALGRTADVPELAEAMDRLAPRIVDDMAALMEGKSEEELEELGRDLGATLEYIDAHSWRRWRAAIRADREQAIAIAQAEAAALAGKALLGAESYDAAADQLQRAVALDPARVAYRLVLLQSLAQAERVDEAEALLEEWSAGDPTPTSLFAKAWTALRAEDGEAAVALLDEAIELDPDDPTLRQLRAGLHLGSGRLSPAADDLRVIWEGNPTNWQILFQLYFLYGVLGRLDDKADITEAWAARIEPAIRAATQGPLRTEAMEGLASDRIDRMVGSGELADQLRARAALFRAQARLTEGDEAGALEVAREAIAEWPAQYAPWAIVADLLTQSEAARRRSFEDVEPEWAKRVWGALVEMTEDRGQEALAELGVVALEHADIGVVHWMHGIVARILDDTAAAIAAFTRATELDPDAPTPWMSRGEAFAKAGRLEEAIADYDVALNDLAAGEQSDPYFRRGEWRRLLGQYRRAIKDFDTALSVPAGNPSLPPIIIASRGQAKLGLALLDEAVEDLTLGLEKNPSMGWALSSRASAHLALHDVDAAIADQKGVVSLDPTDASAWTLYAMMLIETDQSEVCWDELAAAADEHAELLADVDVRYQLARAAIGTGRYEEAEAHFGGAAELAPDEEWYAYEQARAVRHQGRSDEALRLVETVVERSAQRVSAADATAQARANHCLYLVAADRPDEAEAAWSELLDDLDDASIIETALVELDELEASGFWSERGASIRETLRERHAELSDRVVAA